MDLLPLTTFIFSLFAENMDMGKAASDVKGKIIGRYKGLQVEEPIDEAENSNGQEEPAENDDDILQKERGRRLQLFMPFFGTLCIGRLELFSYKEPFHFVFFFGEAHNMKNKFIDFWENLML